MENHNAMGIEGHFRLCRHDTRGLYGSGHNGEVTFEDLWDLDENGKWRTRHPERLVEDRTVKNKFTRRGLNYLMYMAMHGVSGNEQSKQTAELTWPVTGSINPFQALILVGDNAAVTPTRPGDAKVDWNESDGHYNAKITGSAPDPDYSTSGIGYRGCRISDTSTAIFKRVQIRNPNSSPNYEETEYTFFASANAVAQWGGALNGKDSGIDNLIIKSIGLCNLLTGASSAPWIAPGNNEEYSQWGIRAVLGLMPTFQGKCDRAYYHEWFGQGDGTAQGQGTVPTPHVNGTDGSPKYLLGEAIDNDGYVSSYDTPDATISSLTSVSISIDATNKRVQVTGMTFLSSHVRKVLKVRNMTTAGNNKDYKIKRIHAPDEVEVFETPANTETDASADATLVTRWAGISAFDGRVENEGLTEKLTPIIYDADAAGTIIQGERWASQDVSGGGHYVGRIWPTAKVVTGVRIVFPKGSIRDFCPKYFVIQYLASGNPEGGTWTTVTGQSYLASDQSGNIFDNGEYGYEYIFASPTPSTYGIRIAQITAVDSLRKAEIAELYIFGAMTSAVTVVTGSSDQLKLSVDGLPTYKTFTCPALSAVTSIATVCDAVNRSLYGWGLECVRSTFGYFWLRATCAGKYSVCHLTTVANNAYSALGLPTSGTVIKTGVTQPLTKLNTDALTIIYTPRMAGNLPKP